MEEGVNKNTPIQNIRFHSLAFKHADFCFLPSMLAATVGTLSVLSCTLSSSSTNTGSRQVLEHIQDFMHNSTICNSKFKPKCHKITHKTRPINVGQQQLLKPLGQIASRPEQTVDSEVPTCPLLMIGQTTGPGSRSEMDTSRGRRKTVQVRKNTGGLAGV